jgi:hypothetical protein
VVVAHLEAFVDCSELCIEDLSCISNGYDCANCAVSAYGDVEACAHRGAELRPVGVHDDGSGLSLEVVEEV